MTKNMAVRFSIVLVFSFLFGGCASEASGGQADSCRIILEKVDKIEADEFWGLDYTDMLQAGDRSLLRVYYFADYRVALSKEPKPLAYLAFSETLKGYGLSIVRVSSIGGAKIKRVGLLEDNRDFSFQMITDYSDCTMPAESHQYAFKLSSLELDFELLQ